MQLQQIDIILYPQAYLVVFSLPASVIFDQNVLPRNRVYFLVNIKVIAASKLALPRYTNLYALIELQYSMQNQAMSKGVQVCMPQSLTVFCGELDNVCRCTNLYATSRSYRIHSLGNTISCFRSAAVASLQRNSIIICRASSVVSKFNSALAKELEQQMEQ